MSQGEDLEFKTSGITINLRDWFAGQALRSELYKHLQDTAHAKNDEGIAKWAYEVADALIKARQSKEGVE